MSSAILKNFRGLRALVAMNPGTGREILERTLGKLGLVVIATSSPIDPEDLAARFDLVFFDADDGANATLRGEVPPSVPLIAVIGSEAPSHLARIVRFRAASHISKPVRSSGVFTAILLAMNEHAVRMGREKEMQSLRRRLAGRRSVIEAVLALMKTRSLDEETAYKWLRHEAMQRRMPMEDMAQHVLDTTVGEASSQPKTGATGTLNETND